jgi:hypothetical protein
MPFVAQNGMAQKTFSLRTGAEHPEHLVGGGADALF